MNKVIAKNRQSLIDIAVQLTGKAENAFWIALENGIVPTDPLPVALEISIPGDLDTDVEMVAFYARKNIEPATALSEADAQDFELTCEEKIYQCFKD